MMKNSACIKLFIYALIKDMLFSFSIIIFDCYFYYFECFFILLCCFIVFSVDGVDFVYFVDKFYILEVIDYIIGDIVYGN